eukprot:477577-Rhodomonas_salina.1
MASLVKLAVFEKKSAVRGQGLDGLGEEGTGERKGAGWVWGGAGPNVEVHGLWGECIIWGEAI